MALKDIWKDLQNAIEGVPNSGDDISADTINDIARAVIDIENDYATIAALNKILVPGSETIVNRAENDDNGNKIRLTYAKKTDIVTSYNDLTDKPITVLKDYPLDIDDMLCGTFIYVAKDNYEPSIMVIAGFHNDVVNETPDGGLAKTYTYRQHIIDSRRGFYVREKAVCDYYPDWSYDWKEVPLDENAATKEYVNSAIGDVETSLENIIAKYGLGGDEV